MGEQREVKHDNYLHQIVYDLQREISELKLDRENLKSIINEIRHEQDGLMSNDVALKEMVDDVKKQIKGPAYFG